MTLTTLSLPPPFPAPSLADILQSWERPAPEASIALKAAHAVAKPVLGAVWLGHCQDYVIVLNGTYADSTFMPKNSAADLSEARTNLTAVTHERDDALAQVHSLNKTLDTKIKAIKKAKKAGRHAVKEAIKKEKEARHGVMTMAETAHAQDLQVKDAIIQAKDAEIAALRAQRATTQQELAASQCTVKRLSKIVTQEERKRRALREAMVKYLVASQEHLRRAGQTLGFFLAAKPGGWSAPARPPRSARLPKYI
jgi:hypothetical protein